MISGKGEVRNQEGVITGYQVVLTENNPLTVIPAFIPQDISKMEDDMVIRLAMEEHYRKYFPDKAKVEAIQQVTAIEEKVAELDKVISEAKENLQENTNRVLEAQGKATEVQSSMEEMVEKVQLTLSTLGKVVMASNLPVETMEEIVAVYPSVEVGDTVEAGKVYQVNGKLVEAIQSVMIDAENWLTDPSIFKGAGTIEVGDTEVIPDFVQPTGAHDAYNKGDRVVFEGKIYESLIPNNVYSPTSYPQGWQVVE